jgi:hypothetical protein
MQRGAVLSDVLTLDVVDSDGAIREALDDAQASSRSEFIRRAVIGGGSLVAGGVAIGGLPQLALGAPSKSQDVKILQFALTLEYLEAAFYTQAVRKGKLKGEALRFAQVVGGHERAHVAYLRKALGSKAVKRPKFDFMGTTSDQKKFLATAVALEDTGVGAYNGQGPRLTRKTLGAAAQIVSVEARHAAWVRDILRMDPAPDAFDKATTKKQVLAAVKKTGFIVR